MWRVLGHRLFILSCLPIILFSQQSFSAGNWVGITLTFAGSLAIFAGVLLRLWAALYLRGRKHSFVVTYGPFSMVRNPLYLANALLGIGGCLVFENVLLIAILLPFLIAYHAIAIRGEEENLASSYGSIYHAYVAAVPRLVPKPSLYKPGPTNETTVGLSVKYVPQLLVEAFLFLLIIPAAEGVKLLRAYGILPTLWNL